MLYIQRVEVIQGELKAVYVVYMDFLMSLRGCKDFYGCLRWFKVF